jgi:hypothetical protein
MQYIWLASVSMPCFLVALGGRLEGACLNAACFRWFSGSRPWFLALGLMRLVWFCYPRGRLFDVVLSQALLSMFFSLPVFLAVAFSSAAVFAC